MLNSGKGLIAIITLLLFVSLSYAYPIVVPVNKFRQSDGAPVTGTYEGNFTIYNSTNEVIFNNVSDVTFNVRGESYKIFNISYNGNDSMEWEWCFEGSCFREKVGYTFNSINTQYLQGKGLSYFAPNSSLDDYYVKSLIDLFISSNISKTNASLTDYVNLVNQSAKDYMEYLNDSQTDALGRKLENGTDANFNNLDVLLQTVLPSLLEISAPQVCIAMVMTLIFMVMDILKEMSQHLI